MSIATQAKVEWYEHQYEETKKWISDMCKEPWFWKQETAEEQLISKLVYMTQLRNKISGLKGCE